MTRAKRPSQTFTGLKAMLMVGSMSVSVVGARMLAISDIWHEAFQAEPATVSATSVSVPRPSSSGLDLGSLGPVPTVIAPYEIASGEEPPWGDKVTGAGNPPVQPQGNAAPANQAGSDTAFAPIPSVIAIGNLPPIPAPPAGGGGGGGGGNGGATSSSS